MSARESPPRPSGPGYVAQVGAEEGDRLSFLARKPSRWWLVGIILAALTLRLIVLAVGSYPLESDEAIVGLMARHIQQGERPLFYYGQPYMGAAEAYLAAAVFWLTGASTLTLRVAPLLLTLVFVCLTYELGRQVGGAWVGVLSAAYVAVSPPFLTMWSLKARGGYIETLVLGNAILLLVIIITQHSITQNGIAYGHRDGWTRWALLGFLAGLALWINELILPYLAAALVTLFVWRRAFFWRPATLVSLGGLALGGLPLWVYNWQHPMATFAHLVEANAGGGRLTFAGYARNLLDLARYSAPVLLGTLQSTSCVECFRGQRAQMGAVHYLGLLAVAGMVAIVLYEHRKAIWRLARLSFDPAQRETALLVLLVVSPLMFGASQVGYMHFSEPRYLLPLYSTVPLFAAAAVRLLERRPRWLVGAVAAVLVLNLAANYRVDPALAMPVIEGRLPARSNAELSVFLQERGIRHVYADYWIAYTLAFESQERVVPSMLGPNVIVGFNRYVPYSHEVSVAERPAYVFMAGTESEVEFATKMAAKGVTYRREEVGPYAVCYELEPAWHVR